MSMNDIAFFYNSIIEFVERGIQDNRYFSNSSIFRSEKCLDKINDVMRNYIYNACIKFLSTDNGQVLYSHFMGRSYSNNSRIYITKEIVNIATLLYYRDVFEKTGSIDINMDINNLNVSKATIKAFKDNLGLGYDAVRLKDIINLSLEDVSCWKYNGGSSKKEIYYLIEFCNGIYCALTNNATYNSAVKGKYIEMRKLLFQIKELEIEYSDIQNKKEELHKREFEIIDNVKLLKCKLFEIGTNEKNNLKRKNK